MCRCVSVVYASVLRCQQRVTDCPEVKIQLLGRRQILFICVLSGEGVLGAGGGVATRCSDLRKHSL